MGLHVEANTGLPVLILREHDEPHRVLPIFIGAPEATSILLALSGQEAPRPLTHDLMSAVIDHLGATVEAVEVTGLSDGTFLAELIVSGPTGGHRLDSRPSDGIALAVRVDAPLFVSEDVLDEAGTMVTDVTDEEEIDAAVSQFRSQLEEAEPSELFDELDTDEDDEDG
jgi:bifunctional DNase/RNase